MGPTPDAAAWGELVVQNGRLSGTRWPLRGAAHAVGQKEGCDFRLNAAGVSPLHCVIFRGPAGPVLLDLQSAAGTFVNDEAAGVRPLREGDQLTVGPFHFRVENLAPPPQDAVRVQVAAVVAQQAALTDEEIRLRQQRQALEQHEAQLAAHLEAKRQRLIELRDQAREAFAGLKTERTRYQQYVATSTQHLDAARSQLAGDRQRLHDERQRLRRLRRRMRQRWHRHWLAARTAMSRREEKLAERLQELERDRAYVQREKEQLYRDRCRLNGETELARRQLESARACLQEEQRRWEARRARIEEAFREQRRHFSQQAEQQAQAARALEEERQQWESRRRQLEQEIEGLERRIHHQRGKLIEQEEELRRLEARRQELQNASTAPAPTPDPIIVVTAESDALNERAYHLRAAEEDLLERLAVLEKLSDELTDQRAHLAEQCTRLEEARQRWQAERDAAAAELDRLTRQLREREQALAARETDLGQRQAEAERLRQYLAAWQGQLEARAAAWEADREQLLAGMRPPQATDDDPDRLRRRLHDLQTQAEIYERQNRDLSEAVERMACALLDGDSATSLPAIRAA